MSNVSRSTTGSAPSGGALKTCPFCDGTGLYDGPAVSDPPTAEEIAAAETTAPADRVHTTGLRRCNACSGSGLRKGW